MMVFCDKARGYLDDFDELVLEDEHFASQQIYFEHHLTSHCIQVTWINLQLTTHQSL